MYKHEQWYGSGIFSSLFDAVDREEEVQVKCMKCRAWTVDASGRHKPEMATLHAAPPND